MRQVCAFKQPLLLLTASLHSAGTICRPMRAITWIIEQNELNMRNQAGPGEIRCLTFVFALDSPSWKDSELMLVYIGFERELFNCLRK